MRALTVRQPWAWAIAHGGKTVENRSWYTNYRGLLAIHAGMTCDRDAEHTVAELTGRTWEEVRTAAAWFGAVVAVADLADIHRCDGTCSPWAEPDCWHWQLANVRPLTIPVPARGRQGIWPPQPSLVAAIEAAALAVARPAHATGHGEQERAW